MLRDYRILTLFALIGLVLLGFSIKKSADLDYIAHQKAYYELIGEEEFTIEVKQVNVKTPGAIMVDRCQSCHIGASNPDAVDFPEPLAYHPPIVPGMDKDPHDFNKIGCTVCHDGNGRALETHDAHGEYHGWPKPMLLGKSAQANCFRCHAQEGGELAGADLFEAGRALYLEKACWGCHAIEGVSNAKQAPELTNAGGKHSYDYLAESNVYPKANDENSKMPKFDWVYEEETVAALATYLKGQQVNKLRSADTAPLGYVKPASIEQRISEPSTEAGRALFAGVSYQGSTSRGGCINCHAWRNDDGDIAGGHIGPELTWTVRNRGESWVRDHIINSRMHAPDSIMPSFKEYNDAELDSLVMYLSTFSYTLESAKQERM
jgi:mono/diheme cytochrome c family protein